MGCGLELVTGHFHLECYPTKLLQANCKSPAGGRVTKMHRTGSRAIGRLHCLFLSEVRPIWPAFVYLRSTAT